MQNLATLWNWILLCKLNHTRIQVGVGDLRPRAALGPFTGVVVIRGVVNVAVVHNAARLTRIVRNPELEGERDRAITARARRANDLQHLPAESLEFVRERAGIAVVDVLDVKPASIVIRDASPIEPGMHSYIDARHP